MQYFTFHYITLIHAYIHMVSCRVSVPLSAVTFESMQLRGVSKGATLTWMGPAAAAAAAAAEALPTSQSSKSALISAPGSLPDNRGRDPGQAKLLLS